eukprot:481108_1
MDNLQLKHSSCSDGLVINCSHFNSLLDVMCKYMKDEMKIDSADINMTEVLNDYLHLIDQHNDDKQFEYIVKAFGVCDIRQCGKFRRNNRNRNISNTEEQKQKQNKSSIGILDKIHCHICHCYDIGNRLTIKEKTIINEENEVKTVDPLGEHLVIMRVQRMNDLLINKKKYYQNVYNELNVHKRFKAKFNQLNQAENEEKQSDQTVMNNYSKTYSFGHKFEYDVDKGYDGGMYGRGDSSDICVSAKYEHLKQEITTNTVSILTIEQYNNEYNKAKIHFDSEYNKKQIRNIKNM